MYQGYVIIFGSIFLLALPVLIPIVAIVLIVLRMYSPDSFTSFISWLAPHRASKTGTPETTEDTDKGFTLSKERQERSIKEYIKPGWDPWSPENRERTQALHVLMERNRKINQREEEAENLKKARLMD